MCPEREPYAASSMLLIARLAKQVMRRSDPELLGMDLRRLMALSYLADHDGAHQQELVDALCIDAKNVVLLLNELEHTGSLIRRRDSEDRRRHRVHITTAGRDALERAAHIQQDIEDDVLQALNADERLTLWTLLARAVHGAERVTSHAHTPTLTSATPQPKAGPVSAASRPTSNTDESGFSTAQPARHRRPN
jgi:MarR family transcriptional regulator, lower aerobic nicotinate degradation pathway regulator